MATELFSNQPTTTVSSGGTTAPSSGSSETWTVASSASFPTAVSGTSQFRVADTATGKTGEIILVTNVSGTTWTVTRGAESTTPVAHSSGFTIYQVISAGVLNAFSQGAGGGGSVNSVTAGDASIAVSGSVSAPTLETGRLDQIATLHPPTSAVAMNSQKLTGLANGSSSTDSAAFGQIPTSASSIGGLTATNNLSDVPSASTSRTNLGLGTAATLSSGAVAQTANNLSDLGSSSTARTNLGLGTAATQASSAFDAAGAASTETTRAQAAEALLAPIASPTFTGTATAPVYKASGLTGATAASRYVGATSSGAPASGTFAVGDFTVDQSGKIWICVTAGSPGTWANAGSSSGVSSVSAADTSVVVGGSASAPTVATNTLDVIAADHPPAANWSNNSHKITSLANGTTSSDAAAFGQLPVLAAADTSVVVGGTATAPTVATGTLDVIATQHPAAAAWSNNSKKITSLANGTAASDAAAFGQIPTALSPPVVTFTYGSSGAVPASGTWTAGAVVVDQSGIVRVCTVSGTPGTWARDGAAAWQFWVGDYGALGNGRIVGDAAMTTGTATLTSATANFTSGDVGKNIVVNGALGTSNAPLYTTILSFTNSTTVTLNANATNTISSAAAFLASDDSAAIVLAINAASTYAQANNWKAQVLFQAKSYGLATLTTTSASGSLAQQNALVPIPYPNVNGTTQKLMFELIGVGESGEEQYFDSTIPSMTGTCLVATVAASGGSPSVVGGPSASTNLTGTWANTKAIIKGITVWCGWNSGWTAFDLRECSAAWIESAGAQALAPNVAGQAPTLGQIPTNTNGAGFNFPSNNDNGAGRITVEGYYTGVFLAPRTRITYLGTYDNNTAVSCKTVTSSVVHGAWIGYWSCQTCTTAIAPQNTSGTMSLVVEHFGAASTVTTTLSDTTGSIYGILNWWNAGATSPTVSTGTVMKIVNMRLAPGPMASPPTPPSSGSASTAIYRDTGITLSLSGGTLTGLLIDSVDQHIPAGCVLWSFTLPSGHTFTPTYTGTLANDVTVI